MRFGYTIIYVTSVPETVSFYTRAFDFDVQFLHESNTYAEMNTGETVLAFAAHELGENNFAGGHIQDDLKNPPLGIELAFVTDNVDAAFKKAVAAGAQALKEPKEKPWGQTVAYVRSPDGTLIELCTPMGG